MSAPELPVLPDMNSGPRNFITTEQDHGGIALTICTLMATWVVLCFGVRIYMRATVSGPFGIDDIIFTAATLFGIFHAIVSSTAIISFGMGKSLVLLTGSQIIHAQKAVYAADLIYFIVNALTKCTVALLLARIVFVRRRVYACYGIVVLAFLWGVISLIVGGFQCSEHPGWKIVGERCDNFLLSWRVVTAFDVLIEVFIFAIPVWVVWDLHSNIKKKLTVIAVFAFRLPVIAAAILQIHYLSYAIESGDPLLHGVSAFICRNVELHWGLISATIPTLKPFMAAFNTNLGTYTSRGFDSYGHNSSGRSYVLQSIERKGGGGSGGGSGNGSGGERGNDNEGNKAAAAAATAGEEILLLPLPGELQNINSTTNHNNLSPTTPPPQSQSPRPPHWGKNVVRVKSSSSSSSSSSPRRFSSSAGSDQRMMMMIRQTHTCEVHVEEAEPQSRARAGSGSAEQEEEEIRAVF